MTFNRRSLLAGTALSVTAAAGFRYQAAAQAGEWTEKDLIQLEGELEIEGNRYIGSLTDLNDNGEVSGALIASDTKISPIVWAANGKGKRLKSGEFGGIVEAINNNGIAVGALYEVFGGSDTNSMEGVESWTSPAVWIDGELAPLELPGRGGRVYDVDDDGTVVGVFYEEAAQGTIARGFTWNAGAVTLLPQTALKIQSTMIIDQAGVVTVQTADLDRETMGLIFSLLQLVDSEWQEIPAPPDEIHGLTDETIAYEPDIVGVTDDGNVLINARWSGASGSASARLWYRDGEFTQIESPSAELPLLSRAVVGRSGHVLARASSTESEDIAWFLWTDGEPEDVTALFEPDDAFEFRSPLAINRNGDILVQASKTDQPTHGLVLTRG